MNLLRHICSSIDTFSAQRIYKSMIKPYLRIAGIIVFDGQSPANAWSAPLRPEATKPFPLNAVHRTMIFDF